MHYMPSYLGLVYAAKKKQKQKQLKTRIEHAVQFIPCKGNISKSVYFHMLLSGNSI